MGKGSRSRPKKEAWLNRVTWYYKRRHSAVLTLTPEALSGELQFLIVAVDYMTKWVEAKPLKNIAQADAIKFVKEHIVTRFGIPKIVISDNGTQFVGSQFSKYLSDLGIKHKKSSVAHPQANGQVEVTNRSLLRGIQKRLQSAKRRWPEELPNVLWAYRTTARTSTNETPFRLAYGTEALAPVEVGSESHRSLHFDEQLNEEGLRTNLDLLPEVRDKANDAAQQYKQKTKEFFGKRARVRHYEEGSLVLRATEASNPTKTGKLMPKWEGPYKISAVLGPATYKLARMNGEEVPNTWHGLQLRKFYQ